MLSLLGLGLERAELSRRLIENPSKHALIDVPSIEFLTGLQDM